MSLEIIINYFTLNFSKLKRDLFIFLIILFVFTIPFPFRANSLIIVLLALCWAWQGNWKAKYKRLIESKVAIIFIGLFIYYIFGLIHTHNLNAGFFSLEKKLSIILFPLIFATTNHKFREAELNKILICFIAIVTISALVCIFFASINFLRFNTINSFFYHNLGSYISLHAVYFSLYVYFSLFLVIYFLTKYWHALSQLRKIAFLLLSLFLIITTLLLSSKAIMVIFIISANIYFLFFLQWKNLVYRALLILVFNCFVFFLLNNLPYTKERIKNVMSLDISVVTKQKYDYTAHFTGTTIRLTIWRFIFEILNKEKAWLCGVGIGDSQDMLNNIYEEKNVYLGRKELSFRDGFLNANSHSQYMETLLGLGLFGLIYLLICLGTSIIIALKRRNYIYLAFILLLTTCFFTESVLGVNKGIVFYSFFNSFFAFIYK